ncbi:MAG: glycosyltransferase [Planctomycetes bacterium]|nr:glycosyltransferase [Planctomycetota bacterium]
MTRLAVLAEDLDGPVVRHRVRALLPWLRDAGLDDVRFVAVTKGHRARRAAFAAAADCGNVLLMRRLFQRFDFAALRGAAHRLAFDFDDAVQFRDPFQGRSTSYVRERRFLRAVRGADLVTAGNEYLAGLARAAKGDAQIVVAPTPVDADRYRPRAGAFVDDAHTDERRGFRVGWIGSRSTRPYLAVVAPALREVALQRPDLVVAVMADATPRELAGLPVEFTPWSEAAEVPFLQSLHAGLMPLTDDPWSRGKCGFKLLQTMACGVPSVASPVGVNTVIAAGGAALLAATSDDWVAALLGLADDPAAAAVLGARGRAAVEARWSTAVLGPKFAAALAAWARGVEVA